MSYMDNKFFLYESTYVLYYISYITYYLLFICDSSMTWTDINILYVTYVFARGFSTYVIQYITLHAYNISIPTYILAWF